VLDLGRGLFDHDARVTVFPGLILFGAHGN
jgi:hypothetical protein